tara:strand:+ start:111 stop:389 length:279 start_codon:yes stop_codon:yes gene_type:complete
MFYSLYWSIILHFIFKDEMKYISDQIAMLEQIAFFCFLFGVYWIGVVAFKRGKSLGWSNLTCYITSILQVLSPIILISIPIHFVLWLSCGDK